MAKEEASKKIKNFVLDYKTLTTLVILIIAAAVLIIANLIVK
jgi:hypothetical protein